MKDNGGPAFPNTDKGIYETMPDGRKLFRTTDGSSGMTLRDWFAGMAMQGMADGFSSGKRCCHVVGPMAYRMADIMLKARKKSNQ